MNQTRRWRPGGIALGLALLLAGSLGPVAGLPQEEEPEGHRGFMAANGRVSYRVYCSNCHGPEARGNGNLAQFLTVKPSDLTMLAANNGGEFPTEAVTVAIDGTADIRGHGLKEMPVWGDVFKHSLSEHQPTSEENGRTRARRKITELVLFLQTIQIVDESASDSGE